jgi:hypothetical protein
MTKKEPGEPPESKHPEPPPFEPDPDLISDLEKGWDVPPFSPDDDLIGDLERGPKPNPDTKRP